MRTSPLLLLALLVCGSLSAKSLPAGSLSPDNLGTTLSGQAIHASALRGKVVVIGFWATWCKYCMKEMPVMGGLQAVADKRHLPLQVVYINYEQSHRVFAKATHLLMPKLPGLLLTWDRNGALARAFGLGDELPAMVLLHRNGTIDQVYVGYDESTLDSMVDQINELMTESAPANTVSGVPIKGATTAKAH